MKINTKDIAYIGIYATIILIATFINFVIPFAPQGGLVHLGTAASVIVIIISSKKVGIYSSTIGMTLFDIIGGWVIWAPATFIARYGFAFIMKSISDINKEKQTLFNLLGLLLGGLWMVIIYYIYEVILYGNYIVALNSIVANVLQIFVAIIIGLPIGLLLKKQSVVK